MSSDTFSVTVPSGSLRRDGPDLGIEFAHAWTPEGVLVESQFTGAHLLHLSIAGCVLNDVHREAKQLGIPVDGVKVVANGDFNRETWESTGIEYAVEVSTSASEDELSELLDVVDRVAEIPKAMRAGGSVRRT